MMSKRGLFNDFDSMLLSSLVFSNFNSCLILLLTFILLRFIDEFLVVYYLALMNINWKSLIEKDKGEQIVKSWE